MIRFSFAALAALALVTALPVRIESAETSQAQKPNVASDATRAIRDGLSQKIAFEFTKTPLTDVARAIGKMSNIKVLVDRVALEDAGIDEQTPVSIHVSGISLRSGMNLLLRPLGMTAIVRDEVLWLTTLEDAETRLRVVVYPVSDLINKKGDSHELLADYDSMLEMIFDTLGPDSWDVVGGEGSISEFPPSEAIVVNQTEHLHQQIEALLAGLRKTPTDREASEGKPSRPTVIPVTGIRPAAISTALNQNISFEGDFTLAEIAATSR